MQRVIVILLASLWGFGLLVLGLWAWQRGPVLIDYFHATRLPLATWATRAAAVALITLPLPSAIQSSSSVPTLIPCGARPAIGVDTSVPSGSAVPKLTS